MMMHSEFIHIVSLLDGPCMAVIMITAHIRLLHKSRIKRNNFGPENKKKKPAECD